MSYTLAMSIDKFNDHSKAPLLDSSLYHLSADEFEFFKSQTGIDNENAMKQHIVDVQSKAYRIYAYPCIRSFAFTKLKISRFAAYQSALKLCQHRGDAILLDIGCCFGNDVRKAVFDGWPIRNVIASDMRQGFWDCGHELFKSNPETFPAAFIAGDAFDPEMIAPLPSLPVEEPITPAPDLKTLRSLTPLQGRISAIHASSFFHLFNETRQSELARRVATLLSLNPGSIIFGSQIGAPEEGSLREDLDGDHAPYLHSAESWRKLWDGQIFAKGTVKVDTELRRTERPDLGEHIDLLVWSVIKQ